MAPLAHYLGVSMFIAPADTAPYLSEHKVDATDIPASTFVTAQAVVEARLRAGGFPVGVWLTPAVTPPLVKTITAMYAAGVYFSAINSEVMVEGDNYGLFLQRQALRMLQQLVDGEFIIDENYVVPESGGFFPTEPIFEIGRAF